MTMSQMQRRYSVLNKKTSPKNTVKPMLSHTFVRTKFLIRTGNTALVP